MIRADKQKSPLLALVVVMLATSASELGAQNPFSQPPYLSDSGFTNAANLWMTNPVPSPLANDPVPPAVRQARDLHFDQVTGSPQPLTPGNAKESGLSEGVPLSNQTEIPDFPNRSIVIGTFIGYRPVLTKSGRAIYTEISILVSRVFEDHSGVITPGSIQTIVIPGGTVRTAAGTISFLTQPRKYFVEPGRTYLLSLAYHPNGIFLVLGKNWDLTDGSVRANFSVSSRTPISLIGLSVQQLTTKLDRQFGKQ
jgi:hypothetical protein